MTRNRGWDRCWNTLSGKLLRESDSQSADGFNATVFVAMSLTLFVIEVNETIQAFIVVTLFGDASAVPLPAFSETEIP